MSYSEKYVSPLGSGSHDGSSPANAWTLDEAIAASPAGGTRLNMISGTYTLASGVTFPSASGEFPLVFQGYSSSPGDLENLGRSSATGPLVDTGFPVIDCGSSNGIITGTYNSIRNIKIIGSRASSVGLLYNNGYGSTCWRIIISNSGNSGNNSTYVGNLHYSSAADCDFVTASTQSSLISVQSGRGTLSGCRIWCENTPHASSRGILADTFGNVVERCIIFNFGTAVVLGANSSNISYNSIYNVVNGVDLNTNGSLIVGNVFGTLSGYLFTGNTGGNQLMLSNACTVPGSGRINTSTLGNIISEIGPIALSGSPFVNASGGNFALNNTANAGALCREASPYFGGYGDLGAVQHQNESSSSTVICRRF